MNDKINRMLLLGMLDTDSGGGGGDKPWDEMTWDEVIAATKTDKYKEFEIGAMKELDLGSEGIVHMQIAGIDVDELADGSGYAPLTFISKELLNTKHKMNATDTDIGGWEESAMRTYLKETVKALIPANVSAQIKAVKKYSYRYDVSIANAETTDDIWIPSKRETNIISANETSGPAYSSLFTDNAARLKAKVGTTSNTTWWTRSSANNGTSFVYINTNGNSTSTYGKASTAYCIAIGFCL